MAGCTGVTVGVPFPWPTPLLPKPVVKVTGGHYRGRLVPAQQTRYVFSYVSIAQLITFIRHSQPCVDEAECALPCEQFNLWCIVRHSSLPDLRAATEQFKEYALIQNFASLLPLYTMA